MRKITTYLLLLCFVAQSTSQLWIVLAFYAQRDYIAENLCINRFEAIPVCRGQCYLTEELQEDEKRQESQLPQLKQKEITLFAQTAVVSAPPNAPSYLARPFILKIVDFISPGFIFSVFHPPQMA